MSARATPMVVDFGEATGLDVHVAADPARAVIRGASRMAGLS